MKRILFQLLAFTTLTLSLLLANDKSYGEPLTLTESTTVSAILDDTDAHLGKKVRIEGMVVDVCSMRGCWMEVAGDRSFETIKVKVDDGVIVFPLTAKGKTAIVEGVVEKLELSHEQAVKMKKHEAEEKDEKFDPATISEEDLVIYRLRGLGAIITE